MNYELLRSIMHGKEKLTIKYLKSKGIKVNSEQLKRLKVIKQRKDMLKYLVLPVGYQREESEYLLDKILDVDNFNYFKAMCMARIRLNASCATDSLRETEGLTIGRIRLAVESKLPDEKFQIVLYALNDSKYTSANYYALSEEQLKRLIRHAKKRTTTLLQLKQKLHKLRNY